MKNSAPKHLSPFAVLLLLSVLLSALLLAACGPIEGTAPPPEQEPEETAPPPEQKPEGTAPPPNQEPWILGHHSDYPITSDPAQLYAQATAVVIGSYGPLEETWNMSRDPEDPSKESKTDYFAGRIYSFSVEQVIKGELEPGEIRINIPHERRIQGEMLHTIGPDGEVIQNTTPDPYSFNYIWEFYMEPTPGETCLLFLNADGERELYFPAVEPFTITIDAENRLTLRSNLLLPEEERRERLEIPFQTENGQPMIYQIAADEIEDRVSGMTLEELLAEFSQSAPTPEGALPEETNDPADLPQ